MLTGNRFEELKASGKLPSPSGVALEIMRLTQSTTSSIQDLVAIVRLDPALTGRLVQFANSAHHALRRPITAVEDAVHLLGMHTVRQFALTLSVIGANKTGACSLFDYEGFWSASLARALAAQALVVLDTTIAPQEAFTCAILSNIGQLALASVYPTEYGECLLGAGTRDGDRLIKVEQSAFAIDHRQVTLELLKDWGFPAILIESVARQHDEVCVGASANGRIERFAAQLRLASALSDQLRSASRPHNGQIVSLLTIAQPLALDSTDLDNIYENMEKQWQSHCHLFQISRRDLPPPKVIAAESHEPEQLEAAPCGPKMLVINPDHTELGRLEALLKSSGYRVSIASNGHDGLTTFLNEHPRLIIIEHHDDRMDAIQFCKNLRAMEIGRQVYLMLMTRGEAEDELLRAYAAGVNDVMTRPVNNRILLARVESGVRMIQLQDENEHEKEKVRRHVSKLVIAKRKLEDLAMTDPLTSIPNRRYAFARLQEEWSTWRRTARPLSVMILDVDHFKGINDTLGHQAGDRMLAHIAEIIRFNLRGTDVACRLGGEEFIILAPSADETVAQTLAERLREAIEKSPMEFGNLAKSVTASIGIATTNPRIANPSDLVHLADEALYDAKLAGRNCIMLNGRHQPRSH